MRRRRYVVRYTVNVIGTREVVAASASEACAAVRRGRPWEIDVEAEEAVPYEVSPDDGGFNPALADDCEPLETPPRTRQRHLRSLPPWA